MKLPRSLRYSLLMLAAAAVVWPAGPALGEGFVLGQSKEELKLKYDVSVHNHASGRVTVVFTLADEGRLKPLDDVQLVISDQEKNEHGGYWMDLVVSINMRQIEGGKRIGRIHIREDLAARAEIRLNTHTMDGKLDPLTRLHHVIPIRKYMQDASESGAKSSVAPAEKPAARPAARRKKE